MLANKKARQTDLAGLRAGMAGGLLLGEVEAVELHDLGPGGDEVLEELLLGVGARVDFREGAELRVGEAGRRYGLLERSLVLCVDRVG